MRWILVLGCVLICILRFFISTRKDFSFELTYEALAHVYVGGLLISGIFLRWTIGKIADKMLEYEDEDDLSKYAETLSEIKNTGNILILLSILITIFETVMFFVWR